MVVDKTFVFLLHRPVTDLEQSQLDRLERKVDKLAIAVELMNGRMALLLKALDEEEEPTPTTLEGTPAGHERDPSQSLG